MDRIEHLLTCLAEECGEVAKECCKALRFGIYDQLTIDPNGPRGTEGPTNRAKIAAEMVDLIAIYQMCVDMEILPDLGLSMSMETIREKASLKKSKVEAYMHYARRVGALKGH
ncbi:hypothetical protein OKA04_23310 [Luteolibacter flavescens]|uniref:Uncharacterized protein n=1 Tax=Luteolibacter flavescens TaxID=1859460 RepID=A0ABT3FVU5_9BACT|nr:hypothetical protein [Luteolibacter flavescens]MCW1887685.1 hypothetical protein [Luteolibacter flavescens]